MTMAQISKVLRRVEGGYAHWCPGCGEMHRIPDRWTFDGDVEVPTFNPSVKITGKQTVKINGEWTGEWVLGPDGKALDDCCHYFLHAGHLFFQNDCVHSLKGKTVPLPVIPEFVRDDD